MSGHSVNDRRTLGSLLALLQQDPATLALLVTAAPGVPVPVDVIDRWARQLGQVDLARILGAPLTSANPVIAGIYGPTGDRVPVLPHDLSIPTSPAKIVVESFDNLVGVAAFFDAVNLALNTDHRGSGTNSVEWDKAGTNALSGVQVTLPAPLDLSLYSAHSQVMWFGYIPTPVGGNITQVYVALGTDNANFFYWAIPVADIHLDAWWHYHNCMCDVDGVGGVGANLSNIQWAAIVIVTDAAVSTITNARVDQIIVKRVQEVKIITPEGFSLPVDQVSPTSILNGQVALTGAAQQFGAGPCKSVTIENPSANAVVAIGHDNTVTLANGYRLQPGATVSLDIDNTNRIWVIGTGAQIISYIAVN